MRCDDSSEAEKKTRAPPRADEKARTHFQQRMRADEAANRAIIDREESGFAHDRPRRYGYAARGQRGYGQQDGQAKGRTHVIGAIHQHPLLTMTLFDTSMDSDIFDAWIGHDLIPQRPAQAVVVRDHAAFHQRQDTQQAIQQAGHTLAYLPTYSPDLPPIEHPWAQAIALRRKLPCDIDSLFSSPSL